MNKTAVVWGAAGGIGSAIAKQLIEDGWTTYGVARHAADVETELEQVFEADVSDPRQVEAAVYAMAMETDSVDLWVYAVGDILSAKVKDMEPQNWDRILAANLSGAYLATHCSLPLLAEDGHLVYIGAVSERLRLPGLSAYAAAKAGLEAYAEALGKEERKRRVTVVRPSAVATPLWDKVPMRLPSDAPSPEKVAARILAASAEGHKGVLDLTG